MGEVGTMGVFASKFLQVFSVAVRALGSSFSVFKGHESFGFCSFKAHAAMYSLCELFKRMNSSVKHSRVNSGLIE